MASLSETRLQQRGVAIQACKHWREEWANYLLRTNAHTWVSLFCAYTIFRKRTEAADWETAYCAIGVAFFSLASIFKCLLLRRCFGCVAIVVTFTIGQGLSSTVANQANSKASSQKRLLPAVRCDIRFFRGSRPASHWFSCGRPFVCSCTWTYKLSFTKVNSVTKHSPRALLLQSSEFVCVACI